MVNAILKEDAEVVLNDQCIEWEKLRNSRILITGATGLICSNLVRILIYANERLSLGLTICCLVRDLKKTETIFREEKDSSALHFIEGSIEEPLGTEIRFDYIIHGASPTASSFFVNNPVETMHTAICGTKNMLETARQHQVKGFLYLSSMEAYGTVRSEEKLNESDLGAVDLLNVRSCYPESKRVCEMMCTSYAKEYHVPAKSIRLAQTFGPGVSIDDSRVFAMMARCAIEHKNIVLLTKGESKHPYLYTADAVSAMLCVLLRGQAGETYNAANPQTYCSIYEMGQMVASKIGEGAIEVQIAESNEKLKYPSTSFLNLDIERLSSLGWSPQNTLEEMYVKMIKCM